MAPGCDRTQAPRASRPLTMCTSEPIPRSDSPTPVGRKTNRHWWPYFLSVPPRSFRLVVGLKRNSSDFLPTRCRIGSRSVVPVQPRGQQSDGPITKPSGRRRHARTLAADERTTAVGSTARFPCPPADGADRGPAFGARGSCVPTCVAYGPRPFAAADLCPEPVRGRVGPANVSRAVARHGVHAAAAVLSRTRSAQRPRARRPIRAGTRPTNNSCLKLMSKENLQALVTLGFYSPSTVTIIF